MTTSRKQATRETPREDKPVRTISGTRPAYRPEGVRPEPVESVELEALAEDLVEPAPVSGVTSLWDGGRSEVECTLEVGPDVIERLARTALPSDRPTPLAPDGGAPMPEVPPAPPLPRLRPIGATPSAPLVAPVLARKASAPIPWYPAPIIQVRSPRPFESVMLVLLAVAMVGCLAWSLYRILLPA